MNISRIVTELKSERDRIDGAIAAIQGLNLTGRRTGRPAGVTNAPKRRRRWISAAARKRISQAAKRRWAAWRKMQKKPVAKAA